MLRKLLEETRSFSAHQMELVSELGAAIWALVILARIHLELPRLFRDLVTLGVFAVPAVILLLSWDWWRHSDHP